MQFQPLCTPELSVKGSGAEGEAHPIRCKRWSCPTCAQINRRRVISIAARSCPRAMLTLTVSSAHYPDPASAAQALKRGLRLLRLQLSREPKLENFEFLAVFERHKSGYPHLHLLIKGSFIPWIKLRLWWERITGSTGVHITKLRTKGQAAWYVGKYIGKDLAAFEKCKRWWRSHHFSDGIINDYAEDLRYGKPQRYEASIHAVNFVLRYEGYSVERVGREGIRWRAPPDGELPLHYLMHGAQGRPSAPFRRK